jgi:hypothetical protein
MWDLDTINRMNEPKLTAQPNPKTGQSATYRIHTEDINRVHIYALAGLRFEGFTVTYGTGFYKGESEHTLVLEIITSDPASVYLLAEEIRMANGQESVLVNRIESSTVSVERGGLIAL